MIGLTPQERQDNKMEHLFIPKQVAEHQTYPLVLLLDDSIQSADTANWIAGYADSVSYTHLDVYKRQACRYTIPRAIWCVQ